MRHEKKQCDSHLGTKKAGNRNYLWVGEVPGMGEVRPVAEENRSLGPRSHVQSHSKTVQGCGMDGGIYEWGMGTCESGRSSCTTWAPRPGCCSVKGNPDAWAVTLTSHYSPSAAFSPWKSTSGHSIGGKVGYSPAKDSYLDILLPLTINVQPTYSYVKMDISWERVGKMPEHGVANWGGNKMCLLVPQADT